MANSATAQTPNWRPLLRQAHIYGGLFLAFFLFMQAVTGIALIFLHELVEAENPHLAIAEEDRPYATIDQVVTAAEGAGGYILEEVYAPQARFRFNVFVAFTSRANETVDGPDDALLAFHPYSGELLATLDLTQMLSLLPLIYHSNLLTLNDGGRTVIASIGLAMFFMAIVGLVLWRPRPGQALKKLRNFRVHGPWSAKAFRLHSIGGFWLFVPLAFLGFSAFAMHKPDLVWLGDPEASREQIEAWKKLDADTGCEPATMDAAVARALEMRPGSRVSVVSRPRNSTPFWWIRLKSDQDVTAVAGDFVAFLSPRCLAPYTVQDVSDYGYWHRETMVSLHTGRMFGYAGEAVILLSGIVLMVLPITGVWIWWSRRRRKRASRAALAS
ncbi:MAG: PepSY-associated TM helix domain-containing protein [Pseudomonadota bacterium]